ncbi:hypothetical protein [Azospira sp. I09]|uniref:hypothetical protein n=1 Tax=Azospira sp. I09 TaxID=1765049 RepID=UPI0012A281C6|nr:hypothetical protein [Azospira sp. I09]BBN90125.1 hypothetical protein AZSP09_31480 [Azospira sp. I09]
MTHTFSPAEIARVSSVPFRTVLEHLGAHVKQFKDYTPLDPSRCSVRLQVGYHGRDYRLVVTGEKFVNELQPLDTQNRGGSGTIDLVINITGLGFVQSVKNCLDAIKAKPKAGR